MATIVNNPAQEESGSGIVSIVGIILMLFFIFLILYYGLPMINQSAGPQVNIPDKVDVNVNQQPK